MLITIVLPQSGVVDLMFAYDLANLVGHISTAFPQVNLRLLVNKQADDGTLLDKQEFVDAAIAQGSDLVTFLGDERRFAPELMDRMLLAAIPEFIEKEARKLASTSLSTGFVN